MPDFKAIQPELERYGLKYLCVRRITSPATRTSPAARASSSIAVDRQDLREHRAVLAGRTPTRYRKVHDDFALVKEGFLKAFFSPPSPPSTHGPRARDEP